MAEHYAYSPSPTILILVELGSYTLLIGLLLGLLFFILRMNYKSHRENLFLKEKASHQQTQIDTLVKLREHQLIDHLSSDTLNILLKNPLLEVPPSKPNPMQFNISSILPESKSDKGT